MKIFKNRDVLWREEDESRAQAFEGLSKGENVEEVGTSVLYADGIMLSLNLLGTEIWKRCEGKTLEEIVSDLLRHFDVDEEVLKKDTVNFLFELSQKGFIDYEE